jgi:hypothetical protein
MGPSCINDGVSIPVQVDPLIWRPYRINAFHEGGNESLLLSSCQGVHTCSCQRIINKWPISNETKLYKSFTISTPVTHVSSGKEGIFQVIVEQIKKKWKAVQVKREWKAIQIGDINISLSDIRGVNITDGQLDIMMSAR